MAGLVGLVAGAAVYDAWAIVYHKQTISSAVRQVRRHPAGNLLWHASLAVAVRHFRP